MGQKVNPTAFRTGIMVGWKSRWYASKREFSELLIEDFRLRKYIKAKIDYGFAEAKTAQGHIGCQVWINQGMYQEEPTDGADAQAGEAPKKPKRTYKR